MIEHTTRAFDADLQELARKIAEMGRLDDEQTAAAAEALIKRDTALAQRVISADDRVDALQRDIEEKAITTIARRQPMAVDLREIAGALRISNDLERVGDLAENIAKRVILLTDEFRMKEVMLQLQRMVHLARDQRPRVKFPVSRENGQSRGPSALLRQPRSPVSGDFHINAARKAAVGLLVLAWSLRVPKLACL